MLSGRKTLFILILIPVLFAACKGKNETIPSYLGIDSLSVKTYGIQGNHIQNLNAVFCYVDGDFLGLFEVPAKIPALYQGKHQITLMPAVFLNGSSSQRTVYPGLKILDTSISFTTGKTTMLSNVVFTYRGNTEFPWVEDFEDGNSTLVTTGTGKGDTLLVANAPFVLNKRFGGQSKVQLLQLKATDTLKYVSLNSFNTFSNLPTDGTDIFLEFDVLSPVDIQLALQRNSSSGSEYVPYLVLYETQGNWKRFYVNLKYEIAGQPDANTYKVIFSLLQEAGSGAIEVKLDNIRLHYLK